MVDVSHPWLPLFMATMKLTHAHRLLFTMSFLDRINVGTAKLAGITADLHMTPNQFNNATVIFFVSYVAFEIPSNLVLKKMRPSRWIPFIMICWSIVQICMGLVTNYGQLLALRFLLGVSTFPRRLKVPPLT